MSFTISFKYINELPCIFRLEPAFSSECASPSQTSPIPSLPTNGPGRRPPYCAALWWIYVNSQRYIFSLIINVIMILQEQLEIQPFETKILPSYIQCLECCGKILTQPIVKFSKKEKKSEVCPWHEFSPQFLLGYLVFYSSH